MMQAELKSFGSTDMDIPGYDLKAWKPTNPYRFRVYVQAMIGPKDDIGEEIFGFDVCSPRGLVDEPPTPEGYAFCRLLLMNAWSYERLEQALTELCDRATGDTWEVVAEKLSRFSHWEFEDYQEYSG